MPRTVSVNEATPRQLAALLRLDPAAVARVMAARPFATPAELGAALPAGTEAPASLTVTKADLNSVDGDFLTGIGLSPTTAAQVLAGRPYFFLFEVARVPGIEPADFGAVAECLTVPALGYRDKVTGRSVDLVPTTDQAVVIFADRQARADFETARAGRASPGGADYAILTTTQAESGVVLSEVRKDPAVQVAVPGLADAQGVVHFVDPRRGVVQFADEVSEQQQDAILGSLGLGVARRYRTRGLLVFVVPDGALAPSRMTAAVAELNRRPDVVFAEPLFLAGDDLEVAVAPGTVMAGAPTPGVAGLPWQLAMLGVQAPDGPLVDAGSVVVAVVDTGVDLDHPALSGSALPRTDEDDWNFTDRPGPDPTDEVGHGTFVAGLLTGSGAENVAGICPGARLLPLKVELTGAADSYLQRRDAILYALDRVPDPQRLVINLSWKTTGDVSAIRQAINQAHARGALVVASAGNWPQNAGDPHYPSDYPEVVSVGAVTADRVRASYSWYGDQVDLAAPGGPASGQVGLLVSAAVGGGSRSDFGTSFAAPLVAGAAARVLADGLAGSAAQARSVLEATAAPLPDQQLGHGLVQVPQAAPSPANPGPGQEVPDLVAVGTVEQLVAAYAMPTITARLIVVRRPWKAVSDLATVLGMTPQVLARIAADRPGPAAAAQSAGPGAGGRRIESAFVYAGSWR